MKKLFFVTISNDLPVATEEDIYKRISLLEELLNSESKFRWSFVEAPPEDMQNKAMRHKIMDGEAIDISGCQRTKDGDYILKEFVENKDYCNAKTEQWMWSIGKHLETGVIYASYRTVYYQHKDYECLFLR